MSTSPFLLPSLISLLALAQRVLSHDASPAPAWCARHSACVLSAGKTSPSPAQLSHSSLREAFCQWGHQVKGWELFWLLKHRVKLVSRDLTPSSASPGAWAGGVLPVCPEPQLHSGWHTCPSSVRAGPADMLIGPASLTHLRGCLGSEVKAL